MSLTVSVEELKERFEEIVHDAAERHEDIVVAKNGNTVARVLPSPVVTPKKRVPGSAKGLIWISDDFNDPLPDDILDSFYS